MPSKNTIKIYAEDSFYHVYNRGVEKRTIFLDNHDYNTFMFYLKLYLSPLDPLEKLRIRKTFNNDITLYSFCLMPNHFHLLLKQKGQEMMTEFARALLTSYSMYFNKKYKRVGSLFQGRYKAALVDNDEYLFGLSRYIHRNPVNLAGSDPVNYPYSSYEYYSGRKNAEWINTQYILSFFNENNPSLSYKSFVENINDVYIPEGLLLEEQ